MENLVHTVDRAEAGTSVFSSTSPDPGSSSDAGLSSAVRRPSPDTDAPAAIASESTRQLGVLCNQTYRLLDQARPPAGAWERYWALVEELERREDAARSQLAQAANPAVQARAAAFRDNTSSSRFELYHDGRLAAYAKYGFRDGGGTVFLLQVAATPAFRGLGAENLLIRGVVFHTQKRRLDLIPSCPEAKDFFVAYPQFLAFLTPSQRNALTGVRFPYRS